MKSIISIITIWLIIGCNKNTNNDVTNSTNLNTTYMTKLDSLIVNRYPSDTIYVFHVVNHKSNSLIFKQGKNYQIEGLTIFNYHTDSIKPLSTKDSIFNTMGISFTSILTTLRSNYESQDTELEANELMRPDLLILKFCSGVLSENYLFSGSNLNWEGKDMNKIKDMIHELTIQL